MVLRSGFFVLLLVIAVSAGGARSARAEDGSASGQLRVEVVPDGAAVIIDGQLKGVSPFAPFDLPAGRHMVRVQRAGFVSQMRDVEIRGGDDMVTMRFVLAREGEPAGDDGGTVVIEAGGSGRPKASPWSWITLGTGVALLAGGTTLYVLGAADFQSVRDADGYGTGGPVGMTLRRADDLVDSGETKQTVGAVLLGVGSAAVATSSVLFILDGTVWAEPSSSADARRPGIHPVLRGGPAGAVFGVEGAF